MTPQQAARDRAVENLIGLFEEAGIGNDVRGTWEGSKRVNRMQKFLPAEWRGVEQ
jgi:hypothetical protein